MVSLPAHRTAVEPFAAEEQKEENHLVVSLPRRVAHHLQSARETCERYRIISRCQWAFQQAAIGFLPAAIIANLSTSQQILTPPYMILSFVVVVTAPTSGRGFCNLIIGVKVCLLSYLLVTILVAVNVARHWMFWGATYAIGTFAIAYLTESIVTMNTMLMFVLGMVSHFKGLYGGHAVEMYSSYQIRDVVIGVGLGWLSSQFPFRSYEYKAAEDCERALAESTGLLLRHVVMAFFTESNSQRTALMMLVRRERHALEERISDMATHIDFAGYEPVNGLRIAELEARCLLYRQLSQLTASLVDMSESLRARWKSTESEALTELFRPFQQTLKPTALEAVSDIATLLWQWRTRRKDDDDVEVIHRLKKKLYRSHWEGAVSFKEAMSQQIERASPRHQQQDDEPRSRSSNVAETHENIAFSSSIVGYFLYELQSITKILQDFEEPEVWNTSRRLSNFLLWPWRDLKSIAELIRQTYHWSDAGKRKLIFSLKLSAAMTSFVSYLLYRNVGDAIFGPAQMAFAAGVDTSQAIYIFASQIFGCIVGTVLGFTIASSCVEPIDYIMWTTAVALVTGFFRSSRQYYLAAIYSQFALFASIRQWSGADAALSSLMTNAAGILFYVAFQIFVLPSNPWGTLQEEMANVLADLQLTLRMGHSLILRQHVEGMAAEPFVDSVAALHQHFLTCHVAIQRQLQLLPGAEAQPRLSQQKFPSHVVEKVIQREIQVMSILQPLSTTWLQLLGAGIAFESPMFVAAVSSVSSSGEKFISLVREVMLDTSAEDSEEHQAVLQRIGDTFTQLEAHTKEALQEFALAVGRFDFSADRGENVAGGSPLLVGPSRPTVVRSASSDGGISDACGALPHNQQIHLLDTVMYCSAAIPEHLFELFRCVSDLKSASRGM